ncbi:hypothetical protein FRZ44_11560 [Hypericibacter terrae]|uniref:Uncharacterized protein n=1 Tax=Hypericibacter terrae TaxID=2602015 RepID=A0A5J6MEI4_9PROT|nr:hypothetical protein FRZ44_11560 [Hypericibacter terrae]
MVDIGYVSGEHWRSAWFGMRQIVEFEAIYLAHTVSKSCLVVGAHAITGVGRAAAIIEAGKGVVQLAEATARHEVRTPGATECHR